MAAQETLSPEALNRLLGQMLAFRDVEKPMLDGVHRYVQGKGDPVYIPKDARTEFRWVAKQSRVNVLPLVVDTLAQCLFVDGYRTESEPDNAQPWEHWQSNRMDARQTGVHRAAMTYGASYMVVLPGDIAPAWSPRSPRQLTAVYGDAINDEWPLYALDVSRMVDGIQYDVLAPNVRYRFKAKDADSKPEYISEHVHGVPWCPVVRFVNCYDLDGVSGEIAPLIPLQDQINLTTFNLLMASIYSAFRQKWVTGMEVKKDEHGRAQEPFKAAVNRIFVGESPDTQFGSFDATDLNQYLASRESSMRNLATIAQVPPNHLIGQMANLSAEALAAAEVQQTRKVAERKALFGEAWEQTLRLSDYVAGNKDAMGDTQAQVRWRDTGARSFAATVDALGKAAQMLGVPQQALWELIPGVSEQDVKGWKAAVEKAPPAPPNVPAERAGEIAGVSRDGNGSTASPSNTANPASSG